MPLHPILRPPTRVSRLYPLMTLVLMIGSSSLVYAWQNSQLTGDSAIRDRDRQISELTAEVEELGAQSKLDKASLQSQQEQIAQMNSQLKTIESDLVTKTQLLKDAEGQLAKQKDQLATNSSELEKLRDRPPLFSFQNESSLPDIEAKKAAVKEVVTSAYDYIQNLYGQPYLLNSITITFVDGFSIAGASGEIEISNGPKGIAIDIHIKDFDKNDFQDVSTIIHETIHGFHGIGVFDISAMEEGITVAATDAVMSRMIADGKLPKFSRLYLIITESQYADYNSRFTIAADNDDFYGNSQISKIYQLLGAAWYKLYAADSDFFKKFNQAYYSKVQKGETVDAAGVRDIIASIVPTVGSTSISAFLQQNRAFNPN
ncbi:MAG TPA: hypothetical protein VLA04_03375 [Verrucomicrobiae bacterium]|nr:hypothetical protein [Verrucomicrobiae bacterium]